MVLPSVSIDIEAGSTLEGAFLAQTIGSVVSLENGSIIIKVRLTSLTELVNFMAKYRGGCLLNLISTWLARSVADAANVSIHVEEEQMTRIKEHYKEGIEETTIYLTMC